MPTRVITGGVAALPGATMLERKLLHEEVGFTGKRIAERIEAAVLSATPA
jgi:proline racemase